MARKKSTAKKNQTRLTDIKKTVSSTASSVIVEIDKASDVVVREIREGFNSISDKAKVAAKSAADASVNVKDIVSDAHPKEIFLSLVDEVEDVAEGIINVVKERFNQLGLTAESSAKKKAVKKKAAKKKAVKKKAVKKKAVKKKAVKKKAVKKKAVKKKAVKKKAVKKKAVKKKAVKKKAVKKKYS
ncbi:MAG: hypothetical protein U9N50_07075 [Pseudomonadota bacterium]|nr:hypothetical protein [Pseudomonadota bacterium]